MDAIFRKLNVEMDAIFRKLYEMSSIEELAEAVEAVGIIHKLIKGDTKLEFTLGLLKWVEHYPLLKEFLLYCL